MVCINAQYKVRISTSVAPAIRGLNPSDDIQPRWTIESSFVSFFETKQIKPFRGMPIYWSWKRGLGEQLSTKLGTVDKRGNCRDIAVIRACSSPNLSQALNLFLYLSLCCVFEYSLDLSTSWLPVVSWQQIPVRASETADLLKSERQRGSSSSSTSRDSQSTISWLHIDRLIATWCGFTIHDGRHCSARLFFWKSLKRSIESRKWPLPSIRINKVIQFVLGWQTRSKSIPYV